MSEFRKYRLVSKLLDIYGVTSTPQKYVTTLNNPYTTKKIDVDLNFLTSKASDPGQLQQIIFYLKNQKFEELENVLRLMQVLVTSKSPYTSIPVQEIMTSSIEMKREEKFLEPILEKVEPFELKDSIVSKKDDDLDELTNRLNKANNLLGRFHSLNVENSSVFGGSSELKIRTFRNDYENCADQYPLPLQEIFLMEDLLNILLGVPGRFIYKESNWEILVDESLSPNLLQYVLPIIRSSCCFDYLEKFALKGVGCVVKGRVGQALATSIYSIIQEFKQVIILLERKFTTGNIGLQQVSFHLQPYEKSLKVIHDFIFGLEERNISGGAILVELEKLLIKYSGDKAIYNLLDQILIKSSIPFLGILARWLRTGLLVDEHAEFFIRKRSEKDPLLIKSETSSLHTGFVVVEHNISSIFKGHVEKIHQIGSYLNILRGFPSETPVEIDSSVFADDQLVYEQRRISQIVDRCFSTINHKLMTELVRDDRLLRGLRLCKKYYFCENVDWINSFWDEIYEELTKPANAVVVENVHSSWDNTIRATFLPPDEASMIEWYPADLPFAEQLQRIITNNESSEASSDFLKTKIQGLDIWSMRINFDFPDTIIFSKDNLSKYELLFRMKLKLIDLLRTLSAPIKSKRPPKAYFLLRKQMLHFVENLHQYLAYEVIEPNWTSLQESVMKANGMDHVLQLHVKFIDTCLRQAMLTNSKLVQTFSLLFSHCSRLHNLDLESTDLNAKVSVLQNSFSKTMRMFLEALQYYSSRDYDYHLGTLFSRLDYNSYYYSASFANDSLN